MSTSPGVWNHVFPVVLMFSPPVMSLVVDVVVVQGGSPKDFVVCECVCCVVRCAPQGWRVGLQREWMLLKGC